MKIETDESCTKCGADMVWTGEILLHSCPAALEMKCLKCGHKMFWSAPPSSITIGKPTTKSEEIPC